MAEHAERVAEIWARRWVDVHERFSKDARSAE